MSSTIPEGWVQTSVGDVASIKRGIAYIASELVDEQGGTPLYVNMKSFRKDGGYNIAGEKYFGATYRESDLASTDELFIANTDVTPTGDIIGAPALVPRNRWVRGILCSHHVSRLIIKKRTYNTYLYYLFCSDELRSFMKQIGRGTTVKMLDTDALKKLTLNLPPLPEQQKIATILSSVDDVIEKTRVQIDMLKDLKTGMMQELLTKGIGSGGVPHTEFKDSAVGQIPTSWDVVELKEIAAVKGGKRMPKGKPFADHVTPHPYIRVSDFRDGTIRQENLKYVLPEDQGAIKRYTISKHDLYISIAGTIGMVGSVPVGLNGAQLTENAAKIVFNDLELVCLGFIKHVMISAAVQERLNQQKGTGGGVPKLALFRIESTVIPLPNVAEQRVISRTLDSVDNRLIVGVRKLEALRATKKALMQDLLTGKVRVKIDKKEKEPAVA